MRGPCAQGAFPGRRHQTHQPRALAFMPALHHEHSH